MKNLAGIGTRWVLALSLLLAVPAASAEELKIGGSGALSGAGTDWGIALQRGIQVAMDEINAAGGVKVGSKTYTLKLVIYDDQYTAQGGTTVATRLINVDGVKFIIGPVGSPAALGVIGVTGPAKVIALTNGYNPKILSPESKYNFRIQLPTEYFAPGVASWLSKTYPHVKKAGFITPNDSVGQSLTPIHIAVYKELGIENVSNEMYDRGLTDFNPLITRMMARGADLLELDGTAPGDAGLITKQARQLGFKGLIIQTGGPGIDEVIKVAGKLAEDFLSYDLFDPNDKSGQTFVTAYRAKYQGPINGLSAVYYNTTKLLAEAIRRAGTLDTDKVRDQIEKLDGFPSLFGPVRWGGQARYGINHQLLHDFFVSQVKNGQVVPVGRVSGANFH